MKTKRNIIFFLLCLLLALLPLSIPHGGIPAFAGIGIACTILGISLIRIERHSDDPRSRKIFFVIAGSAALGPAFGILHNVPVIQRAWECMGVQDEPVFFLLAALICPALFVISAAVCMGMLVWDHFAHRSLPGG